MKRSTRAAIAATALALAACLTACGGGSPAISVHGQLETAVSVMDGTTPGQAYPDITDGGQVVIVNSGGTVIATGTLDETSLPDTEAVSDYYTFSLGVPGGLPRYGIRVGDSDRGTVWETAAQMHDPELCLGDGC